jgi:hypothetical protein
LKSVGRKIRPTKRAGERPPRLFFGRPSKTSMLPLLPHTFASACPTRSITSLTVGQRGASHAFSHGFDLSYKTMAHESKFLRGQRGSWADDLRRRNGVHEPRGVGLTTRAPRGNPWGRTNKSQRVFVHVTNRGCSSCLGPPRAGVPTRRLRCPEEEALQGGGSRPAETLVSLDRSWALRVYRGCHSIKNDQAQHLDLSVCKKSDN